MFKFQYQNGKKRKSGKRFSGLQNGVIRGLQIGVGFRDYKSGQGFQIGTKRFQIGTEITNRCRIRTAMSLRGFFNELETIKKHM